MKKEMNAATVRIAPVEEMQQRRKLSGYSYADVAERAHLPLGTVQKVLGGYTKTPRRATLTALDRALFPEKYEVDHVHEVDHVKEAGGNGDLIGETAPLYRTVQPLPEMSLKAVRRKAYALIDRLPEDSLEALIAVMVRMLPENRMREADTQEDTMTPKMRAFLDMQEMRKQSAAYDIGDLQRQEAVEEKFGPL